MTNSKLPGFATVGIVGFLIDASILTLLMTGVGLHHYPARAMSFTIAVTTTWYLNRRWVFNRRDVPMTGREYASYLTVQVIGAAINLLVFVIVIELWESFESIPVIPLAIGAGVALLFNYVASRRFVFVDTDRDRLRDSSQ